VGSGTDVAPGSAEMSLRGGAETGRLNLKRALDTDLPEGVTIQMRSDGEKTFLFVMNFSEEEKTVNLGESPCQDILTGESLQGKLTLPKYGVRVLHKG
jgi:beta-galactosidase